MAPNRYVISRMLRSCLSSNPLVGSFSELLRVPEEAMHAYERALQANPNSTAAMNAIGMLLKGREAYDKALEFFRAIVQIEPGNGEAWGNLGTERRAMFNLMPWLKLTCDVGHCYLMSEMLQKAYDAYQQALVNLRDAKVCLQSASAYGGDDSNVR